MQLGMYKIVSHSVPGRPGTEEFVPGHLLLPLSRDKGTPGQENCFVPGHDLSLKNVSSNSSPNSYLMCGGSNHAFRAKKGQLLG